MRGIHWDKNGLKQGAWSPEEDQLLISYIQRYKIWNWSHMPKFAGLSRSGKSCRLRWMNYLRPDLKRGNITEEEEEIITNMYAKMGSSWSKIAKKLTGRTDNEIKNYWHTHLKKNLVPRNKIQEVDIQIQSEGSNESDITSISTASESSDSKGSSSSSKKNRPYMPPFNDTNDARTEFSITNGDMQNISTIPILYEKNKQALQHVHPWYHYQDPANSYVVNNINEYWLSFLLETNLDGAS